jgi:LCP family protein required for cell wall assembly
MLSVPRDLSIDVPGYGLQRINTVNMLGEMEAAGRGPALTSAGIERSFGVTPDRYVRLDFNGFVRLIDAVGGVTINVENPITDYAYPTEDGGTMVVEFAAGAQHMDGERALIYARTRHADDDYRRAERQQQVIGALLGRLILPWNWPGIVVALSQAVDTDLNVLDMALLAPTVIINGGRGERLVINRDYITATAAGVAIPDYERIAPWLEVYFD